MDISDSNLQKKGCIIVNDYKYPKNIYIINNVYIDDNFKTFIQNIYTFSEYSKVGEKYDGFLINSLFDYSNISFNYINNSYEVITKDLSEEIIICFFKMFSILTGSHLAFCYKKGSKHEQDKMENIHMILKEGI